MEGGGLGDYYYFLDIFIKEFPLHTKQKLRKKKGKKKRKKKSRLHSVAKYIGKTHRRRYISNTVT